MSLRLILIILALPFAFVLSVLRPFLGALLLVILYFFRPDIWNAPIFIQRYVFWLTLAVFLGWLFRRKERIIFSLNIKLSLILLGLMVLSSFTAVASSTISFQDNIKVLKIFVFMFLLINLLTSYKRINITMWIIMIGVLYYVKVILVKYFIYGAASEGIRVNAPGLGQSGGANYLAMMLCMTFPFLFCKLMEGEKKEKIVSLIALPLWIISLVATGSRSGFLSIGVMLFILIFLYRKKLSVWIMAILGGVSASVLIPSYYWSWINTIPNYNQEASAMLRIKAWTASIQIFKDYPLIGIGQNNFELIIGRYVPELLNMVSHNMLITALLEIGIFGFIIVILILFFIIKRLGEVARLKNTRMATLSNAIWVALIGYLINGLFHTGLTLDPFWWYLGIADAILCVHLYKSERMEKLEYGYV